MRSRSPIWGFRHGGMPRLFTGVRAPIHAGHVPARVPIRARRQLDAVAARSLAGPAHRSPLITAAGVTYVDMGDTMRATFGYAKPGAGYGYSGVKG